jgi:PAS domain S-box-containing protein
LPLKLNLLLIEDNPADVLLIERHLRVHGVDAWLRHVADAAQIVDALDQPMWDAVLCDCNLPGIDLPGLLARLKSRLPDVPIIIVSGVVGEERAVDLLKAGAWDFVLKDHLVRLLPAIDRGLSEAADRRARRAAEAARREGEAQLQAFLDGSDSIAWIKDLYGRFVSVNSNTLNLLGLPAERAIGRTVAELLPPDLADEYACNDRAVMESGQAAMFEERFRKGDGEQVFSSAKFPIRDANGRIFAIGAICRDITEHRALEAAVRESEARANLILDASPEAMLVVDARGCIVRSNDNADRVFGYMPGELVGMAYEQLVPEDLRQTHREFHRHFMANPRQRPMAKSRELPARRRDGSCFPAEIALAPIEYGGEKQIIVTVLDVSERRKAERERGQLMKVVEISGDMLTVVDRDLRYLVANPAYALQFGHTPESIRGRHVRDVLGQQMFADVEAQLLGALEGRDQNFFVWRRFAGGRRVALDVQYRPFAPGGRVEGIAVSLRDVTARVLAEQALGRAQSMARVGSWRYEVAADLFHISGETMRLFGWAEASARGSDLTQYVHPDDLSRVRERWTHSLACGESYDTEHRVVVDGMVRHVHVLGEATRDEHGAVTQMVGVLQDITEVREAQLALQAQQVHLENLVAARTAALQQQTSYLHALIDNFPFRVWLKAPESRYLALNRANSASVGLAVNDIVGKTDQEFLPRELANRRVEEDREVMRERLPRTTEIRVAGETGDAWFETYKAPVFDSGGEVIGTVGYARDITERKALDVAREAALAEAQRLARVRSDFLANMSHEIRTPLAAILGLAQVGLRGGSGRGNAETFARILDSGQLLLGVINDILDFSKIEAGKLTVENAAFDPCEAIDRAVDFVSAQAEEKQLMFTVEEAVDLPAICAGDKLRLSQVLVNLLSNAVKFTERGSVSLKVTRDAGWLRFDVVDTGIGMAPDHVERLFRPFEQADSSTTRRFGGTGLGLAISGRLVDLMGGMLSVDSRPGDGSCFTLRIPLCDASAPRTGQSADITLTGLDRDALPAILAALEARGVRARAVEPANAFDRASDLVVLGCAAIDAALSESAIRAIEAGRRVALACHHGDLCHGTLSLRDKAVRLEFPLRARHIVSAAVATPVQSRSNLLPVQPRLSGLRVLAAEDNALNRVVLEEILQAEGALLTLTEDGERALEQFERHGVGAYDVVLTDIQMPGIDGYETARRILARSPSMPVIGLTAHAMREERERCLAVGMVEHVAKPIDIDGLVDAILRHVPRLAREALPAARGSADMGAADAPPVAPAIDWAALEERFPGRASFIDRLAQTLLRTQGETPARLREAVAHDDRAAIVFIAHTLKGMAGNLMAERLHRLARETEMAAREESPSTGELANRLADAMQEVIEAVQQRLAEGGSGAATTEGV